MRRLTLALLLLVCLSYPVLAGGMETDAPETQAQNQPAPVDPLAALLAFLGIVP